MGYRVDKGVPMPKAVEREGKYPFAEMEVGNSFFVPGKRAGGFAAPSAYGKRHGGKFTVRTVTEDGVKGVRVWRVE